jgi:hypothetical protein
VPYANQIVVASIIGGLSALAAWGVVRFFRKRGLAGPYEPGPPGRRDPLPEREQPDG